MYSIPYYPFQPHQAIGAVIAIMVISLWAGKKHFLGIIKRIFGLKTGLDDSTVFALANQSSEPMQYRTAAIGMLICLTLLYLICNAAGMSTWVFVLFFGLYITIAIAVTRIRRV